MAYWTPSQVETICVANGQTEQAGKTPTEVYNWFQASAYNHLPPLGGSLPVGADGFPQVYTYMSYQSR